MPTAAQTLLGAVLCFVPLFDVLGYEYAFASALAAAPAGLAIGVGVTRRFAGGRALVYGWGLALAHLIPSLALISLNALRVRNCDYAEGLAFFAVLPMSTALYASSLGAALGTLSAPRLGWQWPLAAGLALAPLAASLWGLYWQPQIFAFDHLWGWFAGSLYDENIVLDARVLAFRAGTLARVAALAAVTVAWRAALALPARSALAVAALGVGLASDAALARRFGYRADRRAIEAELSTLVERPGLRVHLPPDVPTSKRQAIADDQEFRLWQLRRAFQVQGPARIDTYVYRDPAQKARLMGGSSTMIAKPWLAEVHIHGLGAPHDVVGHELAHVVAAQFGSTLLGVSARAGVLVNLVLVEGVAEAVTLERGAYDLHTWARALRALGKAPNVASMLQPAGFWGVAAGRAYTVAGSFVRYLLTTYGADPLKRAYASGELAQAYGKPLEALVAEWEAFVDALPLSERERRMAEDTFKVPSIFARPCAHEIAQLRERASASPPREAVRLHREICRHLGDAPSARYELAQAYLRAEATDEFTALASELLEGAGLTAVQRARLREALGDVAWKRGLMDEARAAFAAVAQEDATLEGERLQWVRLWALNGPPELSEPIRRLLSGALAPALAALTLRELMTAHPHDKTLPYLLARQLLRADSCLEAAPYLERAQGHPAAPIESERVRLLASCALELRRLDEAERYYARYSELALTSGERARARDLLERVRWLRERGD